jgi:Uma2 family endonuclease
MTVNNVRRALIRQFDERKFLLATAQFGLVIRKAPLTARAPDLAVFEIGRIVEQDGFIHSPPQFVVEVLAPGEDLSRKIVDYAGPGVHEVWVVTPESRTVEVLARETGVLRAAQTLSHGTLTAPRHLQPSDLSQILKCEAF